MKRRKTNLNGNGDKKTEFRPGKNTQARLFFGAYFGVVFLVLVWNLFHCTSVSWLNREAFLSADAGPETNGDGDLQTEQTVSAEMKAGTGSGTAILLDGEPLLLYSPSDPAASKEAGRKAIPAGAKLRGAAVYGYENSRGLRFTKETVRAEVLDASTKEVLGSGTLFLRNQSPYPNDETSVYIAFEHPVEDTAGKDLELCIRSAGLVRNGISFAGGTAGEDGKVPAAGLYYEKKTWNPLSAFLYFLAEMAVGLGGLLVYGERILPLFGKKRSRQAVPAGSSCRTWIAGSLCGRDLLPLAAVLVLCLVCMGTVYMRVVRKTADSMDAEVLVRLEGAEESVTLQPGRSVRQRIMPGQDGLAGFGICLSDGEDPTDGPVLGWKLLNADGTGTLGEGKAVLSDLRKVKTALEKDIEDEEILQAAGRCLLLPLESVIPASSGREYLLELTAEPSEERDGAEAAGNGNGKSAGESISLLASADTNSGLQILDREGTGESIDLELCLLAAYRNNRFMKGFFAWVCVVLLVSLAGIYVLCLSAKEGSAKEGSAKEGSAKEGPAKEGAGKEGAGREGSAKEGSGKEGSGAGVATVYLVSALCMGLIFSFMTPVYTISDERTHIDSVYQLSNRLLGITDIPGPRRIYKRACDIDAAIANTMPVKMARYRAVSENLFGAAEAEAQETAAAAQETEVLQAAGAETEVLQAAGAGTEILQTAGSGTQGTGADPGGDVPAAGKVLTAAYARSALDNVPLLCYLPAAIGFSIARLAGRNLITMIMFARWANLLACALVMYFAIKHLPRGGACLAVIGLFPKTLQQTASCSYDGLIIAGTFLFIAFCAAAAGDALLPGASGTEARRTDPHRTCIVDLMVLALAGFFVASCKGGVYLPVLGLALLLPFSGRGDRRFSKKIRTGLAASVLGGAAFLFFGKFVVRLISMFSRQSGSASIAAGTKTLYTLSDFAGAPAKLVRIYYNTLDIRGDGLLGELVGKNLCQKWVFVFAFLFIAFLGILEEGNRKGESDRSESRIPDNRGAENDRIGTADPGLGPVQENRIRKGRETGGTCGSGLRLSVRLWLVFLTAASTALVFLSMLLAFTAKGAAYVDGLQGRYFLPLVPLCFFAAQTTRLRRERMEDQWLVYAADVLLAVTFSQIFLAYLGSV